MTAKNNSWKPKMLGYQILVEIDEDPIIHKKILNDCALAGKLISSGCHAFQGKEWKELENDAPVEGDIVVIPNGRKLKLKGKNYMIVMDYKVSCKYEEKDWNEVKDKCRLLN